MTTTRPASNVKTTRAVTRIVRLHGGETAIGTSLDNVGKVCPVLGFASAKRGEGTVELNRKVNGNWITYVTTVADSMLWDSAKSVFGGAL